MKNTSLDPSRHSGMGIYVGAFVALVALTALSFWLARSDWAAQHLNTGLAVFGISIIKAMLVVLCFMHLWWEASWKYVVTLPTTCLAILLAGLLFPDIGYRLHHYPRQRLQRIPSAPADSIRSTDLDANRFGESIVHPEEQN